MTDIVWYGSGLSHRMANEAVDKLLAKKLELKFDNGAFSVDSDEDDEELILRTENGIGIIPVKGPLVNATLGRWGEWLGITGYGDIQNALIEAANRGVENVLMHFDTPGGSGAGMFATGELMTRLKNTLNIVAYSDTEVSSAGVSLAVNARQFIAGQYASVGNIGVMAVVSEYSKMDERLGITHKVYKSTPLKGAGNPYEPISDIVDEEINRRVMESHDMFVKQIATGKNLSEDYVRKELALGQNWNATEALEKRLIDKIQPFEEVFLALGKKSSDNTGNRTQNPRNSNNPLEASTMAKPKLSARAQAAIEAGVPVKDVIKMENTPIEGEAAEVEAVAEEVETTEVETEEVVSAEAEAEAEADASTEGTLEAKAGDISLQLVNKVTSMAIEVAALKSRAEIAEATITAQKSDIEQLSKSLAKATCKAFAGAGMSPPPEDALSAMAPSLLVGQYASAQAMLAKAFGNGGRVTQMVEEEANPAVDAAAQALNQTLLDQARISTHNK